MCSGDVALGDFGSLCAAAGLGDDHDPVVHLRAYPPERCRDHRPASATGGLPAAATQRAQLARRHLSYSAAEHFVTRCPTDAGICDVHTSASASPSFGCSCSCFGHNRFLFGVITAARDIGRRACFSSSPHTTSPFGAAQQRSSAKRRRSLRWPTIEREENCSGFRLIDLSRSVCLGISRGSNRPVPLL